MNLNDIIPNEKQRQIYLLRQQGMKFKEIAEQLGISPSTASLYYKRAENIVLLTEWYQQKIAEFDAPSDIALTKGDVRVMLDALLLFERAQLKRNERETVNKYQAEYLRLKKRSFEKLKKKALISAMGEKKYELMQQKYK
ncbi:MAG: helix-turn-helix domain-containing protein [Oscillospiraceae bacterium]|nr:helix-turn-helix domain-containing protein [Oscillospiraceae bacterium]